MHNGINAMLIVMLAAVGFIAYSTLDRAGKKRRKVMQDSVYGVSIKLLVVSLFLILFALYWLHTLTVGKIDYKEVGPMGDLFNGLVGPFLSMIGIMAAGMAFYVQYQANRQVQEQFNLQQFESQFYEMLKLHRDNLDEAKIEGYEFKYTTSDRNKNAIIESKEPKTTSGKKVFVTMIKEFEAIHLILQKHLYNAHRFHPIMLAKIRDKVGKQKIFDCAYYLFFLGQEQFRKNLGKIEEDDKSGIFAGHLYGFHQELMKVREDHIDKGIKEHDIYFTFTDEENSQRNEKLWLSFNYKPFSGHQSILAHYYRLLYNIVKLVAKQDEEFISYEKKRDYLRILRAMLSNHEQILLFYNWNSGFGSEWEEKNVDKRAERDGNLFFTDYRMIHNIPIDMVMPDFKIQQIFDSTYRNFRYENGRKNSDTLFELGDKIISNLR